MRSSLRVASILVMATALPAAVSGPQARPQDGTGAQSADTIIVTGQPGQGARKQARSYIGELGVAGSQRPVARWLDPVCPRAVGVSKEHAAIIVSQIRRTAEVAGAPVAGLSCSPNFLVVFAEQADAYVREMAQRRPGLGGQPGSTPVRQLKQAGAPVRWWYNTEVRTNSGRREETDVTPGARFSTMSGAESGLPGKSTTTVTSRYSASLISTQTVRAIYAATVIIDVREAEGVRLKSVVDYATLVGLSEIDPGSSPSDSILSLFEPNSEHQALSRRDTAFLSGLYRIAMDRDGRLQRGLLVREMTRDERAR